MWTSLWSIEHMRRLKLLYRRQADAIVKVRQEKFGQVHVFQPLIEGNENEFPEDYYKQAAQITKMLFRRHGSR